jgi:phosphotransferase system enzyme I (PtsI)
LPVSLCGELAGHAEYTWLFLGMGLRQFSMHPERVLSVKQRLLRADLADLAPKVQRLLKLDEPARLREAFEKLNAAATSA